MAADKNPKNIPLKPAAGGAKPPVNGAGKAPLGGPKPLVPKDEESAKLDQYIKQLASPSLAPVVHNPNDMRVLRAPQGEEAAALGGDEVELYKPGMVSSGTDHLDAIAASQGMERVDLGAIDIPEEVIAKIDAKYAKEFRVIPVKFDEHGLSVAVSDPNNLSTVDDLSRILDVRMTAMLATDQEITRALERYYASDAYSTMYSEMTEDEEPDDFKKYTELNIGEVGEAEQPAVVRYVDLIFRQAVHDRASDIHIEPNKQGIAIRFRIDGVLHDIPSPPRKWQNAIISRLKVLSNMDLAEKRVPLDGRIRLSLPNKKLDLRVSTLPTIYGESIVMRILDQENVMLGLEDVGFLPQTMKSFAQLIEAPNGVILMTGPTGSGKTTTLYAALNTLNTPETKLVTLEDPVEYMVPGIVQIQIHADIGLTFPLALRSVLRQSPDVILVGEIRDHETAENAIRAALTGHLVFSTLHTNDAPSAATRLIDMGIKPYLVASSVQAVIAQRLVRRICSACRELWRPPAESITEFGLAADDYADIDFFKGKGCERCNHSGYRGRTAIHEVMVMNPDLRRRVIRNEASSRLKKAALAAGMRSLRLDGWEKILMGQTTMEEVLRISQQD